MSSSWSNHRNAKPEGRLERISTWLGTNGSANGRLHQAAWDQRGMDAVAGARRQNLAPKPGKGMGGGQVTRSGGRMSGADRALERKTKKLGRQMQGHIQDMQKQAATAEKLREQAKNETDRGARRRLNDAARRADRNAKSARGKAEHIQEDMESSWKRR